MAKALYSAILADRREKLARLWAEIPEGLNPFVLEIGSGHGHYLTAYAAAHPDRTCVGIDILADRIGRAQRKRERARLMNLHFIHAEAEDFLAALPPAARFRDIFVLFPDPWPKRRHHKNRIMSPDFLARLAERAEPEARLHFRTDHAPYFEEVRATVQACPHWRESTASWPFELATVFQQRAPRYDSLIAERRISS